jgi:hypothetical protein
LERGPVIIHIIPEADRLLRWINVAKVAFTFASCKKK